jgi:hypothetical protein
MEDLFWLAIFSPSTQMHEQHLDIGHECFFPHPSQSIIHSSYQSQIMTASLNKS